VSSAPASAENRNKLIVLRAQIAGKKSSGYTNDNITRSTASSTCVKTFLRAGKRQRGLSCETELGSKA
jgi:hypothetical protein